MNAIHVSLGVAMYTHSFSTGEQHAYNSWFLSNVAWLISAIIILGHTFQVTKLISGKSFPHNPFHCSWC
jgi:hypothetical protein